MKVSFIVPFHTDSRLVYECLASILAQQTPSPFEVVLVDNGRAPLRLEFPRSAQVREVRCEKPGPAAARNAGALAASGELLAFVDCDVKLAPDWLECNLRELQKHPLIGASQGPIVSMPMNPKKPSLLDRYRLALKHRQTNGTFIYGGEGGYLLNTAACLVRTVAYRRAGGFEERLLRAEDLFFTQALLAKGFFLTTAPAAKAEVRFDGSWREYFAKSFRQGRAEKQLGGAMSGKVHFPDPVYSAIHTLTRLLRRWGASQEVSAIPFVTAVPSPACRLLGLHPFARLVWTGQVLQFFQLQTQLVGTVELADFHWQFPLDLGDDLTKELVTQQIISKG